MFIEDFFLSLGRSSFLVRLNPTCAPSVCSSFRPTFSMIIPFKNVWENMTSSSTAIDSVSVHVSGVFPRALFNCNHHVHGVQIYFKKEIWQILHSQISHMNNFIADSRIFRKKIKKNKWHFLRVCLLLLKY